MAWNDLKAAVAAVIKTNGNQEITGALLQSTLNSIIDQVGANASYKGVATPSTNPGIPDGPLFYLAGEKGVYSNFGGFVHDGGIAILSNSTGSWIGTKLLMVVGELGTSEEKVMHQKAVTDTIQAQRNYFFTIQGKYILKTNGSVRDSVQGRVVTDFLPINKSRDLTISGYNGGSGSATICAFYRADKSHIGSYISELEGDIVVTIPKDDELLIDCVYIRCTATIANLSNTYIEGVDVEALRVELSGFKDSLQETNDSLQETNDSLQETKSKLSDVDVQLQRIDKQDYRDNLKEWRDANGILLACINADGVFIPTYFGIADVSETLVYDTPNLKEWRDANNNLLMYIDADGVFTTPLLLAQQKRISGLENQNTQNEKKSLLPYLNASLRKPTTKRYMDRALNVVQSTFDADFKKESALKVFPMVTFTDDDIIDYQLTSANPPQVSGGPYSRLYPVAASVGVPMTLAAIGSKMGFLGEELSVMGKFCKNVQKKGWEISNHTMTHLYSFCYFFATYQEAVDTIQPTVGHHYTSADCNNFYCADRDKTYYFATDLTWKEFTDIRYIPPFLDEYPYGRTKSIGNHPHYPMEWQYKGLQDKAREYGFDEIKTFVWPSGTYSHLKRMNVLETHLATFSMAGFSELGSHFITPPLCSVVRRISLDLPESVTDNTGDDALFNSWKAMVDNAIEIGAHLHFGCHLYRACWHNSIDAELISNGGSYPDEWVMPCKPHSDTEDYLDTPKDATGLTKWSDWHPCPNTRLYQLWRLFNYIKENSGRVTFGTTADSVELIGNLFECGDYTAGMLGSGRGSNFDDAVYPHYVVGVNGAESFKK